VRGEYLSVAAFSMTFAELPPRARRIQVSQINAKAMIGTTSACAENTHCSITWLSWVFGTTSACAENT